MKATIIFTLSIMCSVIYLNGPSINSDRQPASVNTQSPPVSCTYSPEDIKSVTGHGADIHQARSAASKICFERRMDIYEASTPTFSTAKGQQIIDSCVNIECG